MELFLDRSTIENGLLMLPLFYRLVVDIGLVVLLLLSTAVGSLIVSNCWKGLIGLQSLSFGVMRLIGISGVTMMVIPSFLPVFASSYLYGYITCNINHEFNYLDAVLVSIFFFLVMFRWLDGGTISLDLDRISKSKEIEDYNQLWWRRIDQTLTPVIILTLLVVLGLTLSCYPTT